MVPHARRWAPVFLLAFAAVGARAQVFVVGEKTATADINTEFTATHVELPQGQLGERGRRELVRNLEAEQGFAHRVLPLAAVVSLHANGNLAPGPDAYKMLVYKKGQSAAPGDRVAITALDFKKDRIYVDLNGGPYPKHRFLRHVQIGIGDMNDAPYDPGNPATGCRIELIFEGGIPDLSAPEVKALLEPVVDFGVKTGEQAYADTLPKPVKSAIASHEVLVGMNHRMVLAALGQPESKIRETADDVRYEDWIYGHQPQTVKFVRFQGDRVSQIKIAAMGKAMEIHDQDEMAGYLPPAPVKLVVVKDGPATGEAAATAAPPTLKLPNEAATPAETTEQTGRKVQFPDAKPDPKPAVPPASEHLVPTPAA